MKGNRVIIRADASTQIGTGHLMRCLALAQAWKDAGGRVVFITACQNEGLLQRLRDEEYDIHLVAGSLTDLSKWNYMEDILATHPDAWVVLDGYHFDEACQQRVKEAGHQLLVIDDTAHLKRYYADIVLNQNLHVEQFPYSCEPYTCLLLGTRYVLLRREFLTWRDWQREIPEVARRVLVTLGGSDPENYTLKVIHALQRVDIPDLEVIVVAGANNPHGNTLQAVVKQGHLPIRLVRNAQNMPELMAWSDVAISAAGATIWELLFLKTPVLALILADNQQRVAEVLEQHQIGKNLGWAANTQDDFLAEAISLLLKDTSLRAKMSNNARQIVDGQGAQRVIGLMQETLGCKIKLRPVTMEDCRLLWEWRNDPDVRVASFNPNPVRWDEHANWFHQKLADPHCFTYIAVSEQGIPVGQVRFDINHEGKAEVNVSMDVKKRGKGYGNAALKLACQRIWRDFNVSKVLAHIKEESKTSISAFTKAGFINRGLQDFKEHKAVEMVWSKEENP